MLLFATLAAAFVLAPAPTQGGYRTEKLRQYGLEFPVPRRYEAIPTQPTEKLVVRKWFGEPAKKTKYRFDKRPEALLVILPVAEEEVEAQRTSADGGEGTPSSIQDFFLQRYSAKKASWRLGARDALDSKGTYVRFEYPLEPKGLYSGRSGRAFTWKGPDRTVCLIASCVAEDFNKQLKIWRRMAGKMELSAPGVAGTSTSERYYAKHKNFKDPKFRIELRDTLPRGWKADDTENFIFLYSTKDEKLLRILKRELEAIRKAYLERFPALEEIRAVSAVRVCRDKAEYRDYGGIPGSAGYWNYVAKELVFYDQGKGDGRADSRIVLYHEAFHQYIYYCAGEVSPHSWFNEGHGDYFSGARFSRTGAISKIGTNPWRLPYVKRLIDSGQHRTFDDILYLDKPRFYADGARCYAQAWSIVYFLREAKKVRAHKRWRTILPTYFETLRSTFQAELDALEERARDDPEVAGPDDPEALAEVKQKAREAAIERALAGVDLFELEQAWLDFMNDLKP